MYLAPTLSRMSALAVAGPMPMSSPIAMALLATAAVTARRTLLVCLPVCDVITSSSRHREPNSEPAGGHQLDYWAPAISVRTATVNRLYRFVSGSRYQALRDGLGTPSARSGLTSGR